jgi:tetratricopeptide (TPR) repeat protein
VRSKLYLQRGRIHELDGHYEDALDDYRALHAAARARSDRAMELASVMATLPVYATPTTAHDPDMAKMLADRALTLARKLKDPAAESKILWSLMLFTRWTGDPAESVKYGEQSLEIAREHNVREQIAYTLNDLGVHGYLDTGDFIKALESLTEAQEMWRAQNNLPMLADSYSGIALLSYPLGKFDQAIAAGEQARQISESIENLWGQSYARWIMGNVYADRGEPARAIEVMEECIRLGERAGFGGAEVGVRNLLAAVCLEYGLLERALQAAAMSLKIANERMAAWAPWSHAVYALALVRAGELERAKAEIAFTTGGSSKFFRGRIMALMWFNLVLSQASMALATNARNKSLLDLNQLVDFLFEHKAIALVPDALLARAHILISEEKLDAAYEVLARAREIAEPLSHRRTLWQTYALLEQIETRRENLGAAQEWRDKARVVVGYITAHATKEQHAAFLEMDLVRQVTS